MKNQNYKYKIMATLDEITEELNKIADSEKNSSKIFNSLSTILLILKDINKD